MTENNEICFVEALYDFEGAVDQGGLCFKEGDILQVLNKLPSGWWDGILLSSNKRGWFPSNYTKESSGPAPSLPPPAVPEKNVERGVSIASSARSAVQIENRSSVKLQEEELPENWGIKTMPDGRQYYFNIVTNETRWSLSATSNTTQSVAAVETPKEDERSMDAKDMLNNLLKDLEEQDLEEDEESPEPLSKDDDDDTSLVFSWTGFSINISTKLAALAQNIREKAKDSYVSDVTATVMAIHIMLHSSDMSSKESEVLYASPLLRSTHAKMLNLTATLIMQSKSASNVWPSPDSERELQTTAGLLLKSVREFSGEASRLNLSIKTLSTEELFNFSKQTGSAKKAPALVPKFKVDPALVVELENKLVDISTTFSSFNITHGTQIGGSDNVVLASTPLSRPELVKAIQTLVKLVGEYLTSIDLLPFLQDDKDDSDLLLEFKVTRMSLLNGITDLVSSTRRVVKEKGSLEAKHAALVAVEGVVDSAKELLISAKFLLEEKESVEQEKLHDIITSKRPTVQSTASSFQIKSPVLDRAKSSASKYDSVGPFSPSPSFLQDTASSRHASVVSSGTSVGAFSEVGDAWFLNQPDYSEKDVLIVDGQWKGASLQAYICKLTSNTETDDAFTAVFLSSYRTITSTTKFLPLLLNRFSITPPSGLQESEKVQWTDKKLKTVRFKVYNVLKSWLERYMQDDKEDLAALEMIEGFAKGVMKDHMSVSASRILQLVEFKKTNGVKPVLSAMTGFLDEIPASIVPRVGSKMRLFDTDPVEFARQITLYESALIRNINPSELLSTVWTTYATKNVSKMIIHSKHFTAWVAYSVLQSSSTDPRKRAKAIGFFINTAQELINLRNFNSLSAILQALDSKPVKRLTQTWALLSSKQTAVYKSLLQSGTSKLFAEYRSSKKQMSCVPLFPVILNDFEAVKKNTATRVQESLYNHEKLAKTADLIKDFKGLQSMYQLHVVEVIRKYLTDELQRHSYTEDELTQLSLHVESIASVSPRIDHKKIGNLLGNTGF